MIAIKELLISPVMDNKLRMQLESFKKEIDLMKNFNHPNIVHYLGSKMTENSLFILLEYVPGIPTTFIKLISLRYWKKQYRIHKKNVIASYNQVFQKL
jgi:serine/threonine protein kinase